MSSTEYLVVGAGLAGAATAWRLAQRGHEVTVVERTEPAAHDGSSHGSARIFRYAYPERAYAAMVVQSAAGWAELERLHGSPVLTPTPAVDHGPLRNPRALARVLEEVGVEHELLSAAEASARWPQLTVDGEVLVQPGGAVIDAAGAVAAMLDQARAHGAQVLTGWPLRSLERSAAGFVAQSDDGRSLTAGRVVVAAGGWLPDLLERLALPAGFVAALPRLEVTQENAFHFPYSDEHPHGTWPTTIHKTPQIQVYSLPGGRDAGFAGHKVAEYAAGPRIGSASRQSGLIDPANRERVVEYVRHWMPGLVPEPYAETTCLFTMTPTEDFVIDGVDGVTVLSPCSGHGAKFAPLLGEIAADVASGAAQAPERFRVGAVSARG
ncbi:sarcosine oxidase [Quadrisphaera granulorum]|uniref:Sarcosine oxidase n=1 Tax=Quadrisphaera granulorum TaxID=317664 RepID=A0A316A9H6_9ACTN|nr:FAD-dependent oxidoreductase [Quadrisphaera granulorum]PWJ54341.1 sarcosine oxidase [Quadrisphaera granulorum]SZE96113.1 sarcosine oxidase [Quadrisphaera granulorum]